MSNRLVNETSPYLLSHAENPVDWYPWGEEAFSKAKAENKPVFLSIGYSSCHWCHVMAEESFEDKKVAELLNRFYVPVKVDREERPDVDSVYIEVCTALTGSAGWPLTVIMSPEQQPFFAATYLPKENYGNQMGLMSVLLSIADMWMSQQGKLLKTASEVQQFLQRDEKVKGLEPDMDFLHKAVEQLYASYDSEYGGFGTSPKFPSPHNLIFLLRYSKLAEEKKAREIAEHCLRQMYRGGIFDHIGGGFCRYSTDREWLAPHFEKTLYDNALLAFCYTEAYQEGRLPLYKEVAERTLDYCIRELKSPDGAYYSSQDADSDGVEGKYYLFTPDEVKSVLGEEAGRHFCECYDILDEGNFQGKNIPNLLINQRWRILPDGYDRLRDKLLEYRVRRCELKTDGKILTSWNGLMLMALSRAARVFNSSRYLSAALELKDFLLGKDEALSSLTSCCTHGLKKHPATLDDYVFMALGLLELYEISFDVDLLTAAGTLAEEVIQQFSDGKGAYFLSSVKAEKLIKRPMELFDGAMPSGNGAAAQLFDMLFRLSGDIHWRDAQTALLKALCTHSERYPAGCPFALCSLLSLLYPTKELLCVADSLPEAMENIMGIYEPQMTLLLKNEENSDVLACFAPYTKEIKANGSGSYLYICSNGKCSLPYSLD